MHARANPDSGLLEWRDIADDGVAILVAFALYRLTGAGKFCPIRVRSVS